MVCLQAEARHREVGCSSEREDEGLLKQTQKSGSLQCLSSIQAYLLSWKLSEPNIVFWNYSKEMNC